MLARPLESRQGSDDSRVLLGRTDAGRFLRVVVSVDADRRGVLVITAFALEGKALKALRRRQKKRGQT